MKLFEIATTRSKDILFKLLHEGNISLYLDY